MTLKLYELQFISEKELEKINLFFALMNQISDSLQNEKKYSYKIYYYDVNIYLLRLNNKRRKLKKIRNKFLFHL